MARAPATSDIETLPEADRLEGFPHPRETQALYGHQQAEHTLAAELASGKMHHAWLVSGAEGVGKATLAYRFARAALARPEDRDVFGESLAVPSDTPASRQVTALSHPGLLVIRRGYDHKTKKVASTISVDDVRRLRGFLSLSAEQDGWRVIIVDSADDMNLNAANALLKALEEPPARTVFLVLSSAPGRLLPTIRSRCRVLALAPLTAGDVRRAALAALTSADKRAPIEMELTTLEALSGGSVRRFLALLEGGGLALQAKIDTAFLSLPKLGSRALHVLADDLQPAAKEQKFTLFLELFQNMLARLIRAEATGEGRASDVALAKRVIGAQRLATFAHLWETLAREQADTDALNLDRKALILAMFARLQAASQD